jgi:hypothetical protein
MGGSAGKPEYISVMNRNMDDEEYRKQMAQQQALEGSYPEAMIAAPLTSMLRNVANPAVRGIIEAPIIGSKLPAPLSHKEFLKRVMDRPKILDQQNRKALGDAAYNNILDMNKRALVDLSNYQSNRRDDK